jgi:cell division transport system ATP-binding protein
MRLSLLKHCSVKDAMIEFQHVSKQYSADAMALRDITLTIGKGELVYLAGPSGAGKSTLMKMIAAIERPSSGSVVVNGTDISRLKAAGVPFLRRNLGLIFQQQRLLTDRSVLANVMMPLLVTGAPRALAEQRARAALDKVGLGERAAAPPLALSGGEQQRVSIARAIVNRPQIILADEPTANLDRASATRVFDALKAFHSVGVTCVISTHDEQVLDAAGRVIYLKQGQLEDAGVAA